MSTNTYAIIGGHGQIALHLTEHLTSDGHTVRSLVRNPDHEEDLVRVGGQMVIHDLEADGVDDLARAIEGCDAVVFAAGAGPGSGAARKETVDRKGAIDLVAACRLADVDRYVMVSSMGTDDPPQGEETFEVYLRAKAAADEALMDSDLRWTVVRPGGLTDDEGSGRVQMDRHVPRGEIPRADVASVLATCLAADHTAGHVIEVVTGDTPIEEAVAGLSEGGA